MTNAATESFEIANDFINVRYKGASAVELLKKCNDWFIKHNEAAIRDEFKGSRMLVSQLDLFDKARERVRAVKINCEQMI